MKSADSVRVGAGNNVAVSIDNDEIFFYQLRRFGYNFLCKHISQQKSPPPFVIVVLTVYHAQLCLAYFANATTYLLRQTF